MKPHRDNPPFLGLLFRATIWAPVYIFLMVVWLAAMTGAAGLPILGALHLWTGEYLIGFGLIVLSAMSFFLARLMKKHLWENPPSLL